MLSPIRPLPGPARRQRGFTLIEGLVSILIFSIGVLALVGLQTTAVRQSTQSQYRGDASMLANELIGQMWGAEGLVVPSGAASANGIFLADLAAKYATGGTRYAAWLPRVTAALPGVAASAPTVVVNAATGQVTVTISWKAPNERAEEPMHEYVTVTQVNRY